MEHGIWWNWNWVHVRVRLDFSFGGAGMVRFSDAMVIHWAWLGCKVLGIERGF
jgi:hypothetical protein